MARTHYAKNGEIHIAYQVYGDGALDLVLCTGASTHLDVLWEDPGYRRYCEQLAAFTRLICFDKRGMGLSDRVRAGTLEERMEDVRAVLDATGSLGAGRKAVDSGNRVGQAKGNVVLRRCLRRRELLRHYRETRLNPKHFLGYNRALSRSSELS